MTNPTTPMVEIKESESNKFFRQCMLFLSYLFILMGFLFFLIQLFLLYIGLLSLFHIPFLILSLGYFALGIYLRKRIAKISAIGDTAIELISSKKKIHIPINHIVSIKKMVRFTLSERVWLIITFQNIKQKKEKLFFQTEPKFELIEQLKRIGISLKNIP